MLSGCVVVENWKAVQTNLVDLKSSLFSLRVVGWILYVRSLDNCQKRIRLVFHLFRSLWTNSIRSRFSRWQILRLGCLFQNDSVRNSYLNFTWKMKMNNFWKEEKKGYFFNLTIRYWFIDSLCDWLFIFHYHFCFWQQGTVEIHPIQILHLYIFYQIYVWKLFFFTLSNSFCCCYINEIWYFGRKQRRLDEAN